MLVSENISDILRGKPKADIYSEIQSLDDKAKRRLLFNKLMTELYGDIDGGIEWIEKEFVGPEFDALTSQMIQIESEKNSDFTGDLSHVYDKYGEDHFLSLMIDAMSKHQFDIIMSNLAPGYMSEGIEEILAPKHPDDLEEEIMELSYDDKIDLQEQLWEGPTEFMNDLRHYLGKDKLGRIIGEMIILKQKGQL